jgi:hypothetical protein
VAHDADARFSATRDADARFGAQGRGRAEARGAAEPLPVDAYNSLLKSSRYIYIYTVFIITPGCIQYRECTQVEPTRQEHLV